MTILHAAARVGDTVIVRTLLSTPGALSLINTRDASGATPINVAAQNGHAAVLKQLIDAHCNVDLQEKIGRTPLYNAALLVEPHLMKQRSTARGTTLDEIGYSTEVKLAAQ
jgi:ankyrin repeat protein